MIPDREPAPRPRDRPWRLAARSHRRPGGFRAIGVRGYPSGEQSAPPGWQGARARAGRGQGDLGAIRYSDAVIDLLAGRRRIRGRLLRDPAVALLRSLTADVDAAPGPGRRGRLAGPRHRTGGTGRHHAPGTWQHAAAAAAVATAIAMLTAVAAVSLVVAGTLGQLVCCRRHNHRKGMW